MACFPSSGEITFRVDDTGAAFARVEATCSGRSLLHDETDWLCLSFPDWRLNLCQSNTEPLMRMNVEGCAGVDVLARAAEAGELIGMAVD